MKIDLDELEALALKTETPPPWEARSEGPGEPWRVCHDSEAVIYLGYDVIADLSENDAEFIAAANPSAVLTLIGRLREVEDVLAGADHTAAKYWRRMREAEQALAVFEKASPRAGSGPEATPRDDTDSLRGLTAGLTTDDERDVDVLIAQGFEPSPHDFLVAVKAERDRQITKGYDPAHDAAHGPDHLLFWAGIYARRGRPVASTALVEATRDLLRRRFEPQGEPSDAQVLAALNAMFPYSASDDFERWQLDTVERMRAALRAASAVQGENR
ncbi:hypothetical protein MRBLWO14_000964 [Microbacterium sp. LWO14-1.2]|uniref:hypothetical protein n=1 Tax=Microbacterium sp. LWO14-1.2 TaxID=3135263 RepID=UPI003139340D